MEDKPLDEFQSFCKFNCKYRKSEGVVGVIVDTNHRDLEVYVRPCDYCQVKEFVREVSDRL